MTREEPLNSPAVAAIFVSARHRRCVAAPKAYCRPPWAMAVATGLLAGCATTTRTVREPAPQAPMGMGQVHIEAVTNDPERETNLRISPDGTRLLFNMVPSPPRSTSMQRRSLGTLNTREVQQVYASNSVAMMRLGSPGRTILSQQGARDATWHPNGEVFAFSMLQGPQAMLASGHVGQEGAAVRFLAPTPCIAYDWQPSISPDGQTVLFSTFTVNEPQTLATMSIEQTSGKCTLLFPGKTAQWAPSGKRFVFSRVVNRYDQIFTFDVESNQLTQITFGAHNNFDPAWSPDGSRIVFASDRNGSGDIYIVGTDGTGLIQVTHGVTEDIGPAWSSDGHMYFVSNAGGQWDIWRARLAGQ
jgi:Tol biopolymer transport system component